MRAATGKLPALYGDLARWTLIHADSAMFLRSLPDHSVDAVITDPPYAIGFDGEAWDGGELASPQGFQAFSADWAAEARRVLKPGGHVLAFGSPRTFHRMVAGCEDMGLEVRDTLLWLHARGVPKSRILPGGISTTLKPAYEPILLARAPMTERTARANIERYGTGGLNVDAARLRRGGPSDPGYWPSQIVMNHADQCPEKGGCVEGCPVLEVDRLGVASTGPITRLFYVGKAPRKEREAGLDGLGHHESEIFSSGKATARPRANIHPTVKPIDVMRWLVRLVTPVGGVVLDPFAGSGSTGCAALLEGRQFVGVERESRYLPIARARLAHWSSQISKETKGGISSEKAENLVKKRPFCR